MSERKRGLAIVVSSLMIGASIAMFAGALLSAASGGVGFGSRHNKKAKKKIKRPYNDVIESSESLGGVEWMN